MRYGMTLLLLTAGLSLMPTGPLLADDAAANGWNDRLIGIEQQLGDADLAARKQAQIR
jgi:hypothetical protein